MAAFSRVFHQRYLRIRGFLASALVRAFLKQFSRNQDLMSPQVHLSHGAFRSGRFSSLLLPSSTGRIGNGLVQLGSIMSWAELFGKGVGPAVIVNSEFPLIAEGLHTVEGVTVLVSDTRSRTAESQYRGILKGPLLQADWFYSSLSVNNGDISPGLRLSRSLLKEDYVRGLPAPEDLVIHYRVGDIFGQAPHRAYGPPPHAFFELIVQNVKPRSIRIVAEDFSDELVITLLSRLSEYSEVVGEPQSLDEDVRHLLCSTNLALSVGTFGLTIAGLSSPLRSLYQFEEMSPISVSREKLITVRDSTGCYVNKIRTMNWKNDSEQRDLVISYPVEDLVMEQPAPA